MRAPSFVRRFWPQILEDRLSDKKESLLEKELVLEEVISLTKKLRKHATDGRAEALQLSKKVTYFNSCVSVDCATFAVRFLFCFSPYEVSGRPCCCGIRHAVASNFCLYVRSRACVRASSCSFVSSFLFSTCVPGVKLLFFVNLSPCREIDADCRELQHLRFQPKVTPK